MCCVGIILYNFLKNDFCGPVVAHFLESLALLELGAQFLLGTRIFLDYPIKQQDRFFKTTLFKSDFSYPIDSVGRKWTLGISLQEVLELSYSVLEGPTLESGVRGSIYFFIWVKGMFRTSVTSSD